MVGMSERHSRALLDKFYLEEIREEKNGACS